MDVKCISSVVYALLACLKAVNVEVRSKNMLENIILLASNVHLLSHLPLSDRVRARYTLLLATMSLGCNLKLGYNIADTVVISMDDEVICELPDMGMSMDMSEY